MLKDTTQTLEERKLQNRGVLDKETAQIDLSRF
jgi:hypothetical protein